MTTLKQGVQEVFVQLENNAVVFKNLLKDLNEQHYLWRPKPGKWCLLEIISHMLDEEIYDFRARVKHALEYPENTLIPIDPEGWVKSHNYLDNDYHKILDVFLKERRNSIKWLKLQEHVNWHNQLLHPELGTLSAELFLRNWLAHDYLHIRQILRYKFGLLKSSSKIDLSYAGNW